MYCACRQVAHGRGWAPQQPYTELIDASIGDGDLLLCDAALLLAGGGGSGSAVSSGGGGRASAPYHDDYGISSYNQISGIAGAPVGRGLHRG
jgi:hypothetical protein